MQPLVIRVEDADSREVWVYARQESPVLLGRGVSASLPIGRAFVSEAHGTFAYDEARACWTYADLDSSTGTALGDRRLAPEEVVPLPPSSVLRVGPLALTVLAEAPADQPPSDAGSPFALAAGGGPADTIRLPAAPAPVETTGAPAAPVQSIAGGTLLLPGALPTLPARLLRREPARPTAPPRARAGQIAAVVAGATLASGLVTWLVVHPSAPAPRPATERTVVEPEPERPPPPAPRPAIEDAVSPGAPPAAAPAHPRLPAPANKPAARSSPKPRRGANGAYVLE
jgi:hypothetical protein